MRPILHLAAIGAAEPAAALERAQDTLAHGALDRLETPSLPGSDAAWERTPPVPSGSNTPSRRADIEVRVATERRAEAVDEGHCAVSIPTRRASATVCRAQPTRARVSLSEKFTRPAEFPPVETITC